MLTTLLKIDLLALSTIAWKLNAFVLQTPQRETLLRTACNLNLSALMVKPTQDEAVYVSLATSVAQHTLLSEADGIPCAFKTLRAYRFWAQLLTITLT